MSQINFETARNLSQQDLQAFGLNDVAYVKSAQGDEGETVFVVHAADGQVMGTLRDRQTAFAAVQQQGLVPLSVH